MPEGALTEVWTSPPFNHCMFTARPDLDPSLQRSFARRLSGMDFDNPVHRAVLEAEGLRSWMPPATRRLRIAARHLPQGSAEI